MWLYLVLILFTLGVLLKIYTRLTVGRCNSKVCLVGKTVIVTGANTGIGYDSALDFAKRGARVILACRNADKAEEARDSIIRKTKNKDVVIKLIDLASFDSVRAFAKNINDTESRLDILVNNAGAGSFEDRRTKDGHVFIMQVNHFSSFLLTHLLLDLMKKTGNGRIVNVSSVAAKMARNFNPETLDVYPGRFNIYRHSKLCNILFTQELAKKLKNTTITTYSLHPGAVHTDFLRFIRGGWTILIKIGTLLIMKTSEEGAQTTLHCALEKGIERYSGEHFSDCVRIDPYKSSRVPGLAERVWEVTEKIVQLQKEERI